VRDRLCALAEARLGRKLVLLLDYGLAAPHHPLAFEKTLKLFTALTKLPNFPHILS
jgi:hypothetical protein